MATKRLSHGEKIHSNEDGAPTFSTDKEHTALAHICSMSKSSSGGSSEEKGADIHATPAFDVESGEKKKEQLPVSTAEELVTNILHVDDDPTLNPWTFRMWFIGIGLSVFGATLETIYYFKPQTLFVSVIFLTILGYILGEIMEKVIPKSGWIGRYFNPHKFNHKEHTAIVIMAAAASTCALGVEVLAVQKLYYQTSPNAVASIFLLFASQLLGYGVAGLMRSTLVYPTKMLYPSVLPLNTLLETLHRNKYETAARLKLFYYAFLALFLWEVIPEYCMPILTGISVFCLANRNSAVFTNLFGGANGNEGLGLLSICLDWQYIAGTSSPLWYPLQTLVNNLAGYVLCIIVFLGVYYMNTWRARDFPFLSQSLFSGDSNGTHFDMYNQTALLDEKNVLNPAQIDLLGIPYFASTYLAYILTTNVAITATFTHMLLWNYDDLKSAWSFLSIENARHAMAPQKWRWKFWEKKAYRPEDTKNLDPHYKLMLAYADCPSWWYGLVLLTSVIVGLVCLYSVGSTLPWWGFIVACMLSALCILFFGAQYAVTGFQFITQYIIQMLGGYLHPGKPVANMYFTLFGYNSVVQGQLLLRDLKIAQYAKLPPKCTFTMQVVGTLIGSVFNYVMMFSIVDNKRDILLSIEGSNVWSGQHVQQYNSQAIAWGALAKYMFSVGARYQWVTLGFLVGFVVPLPLYFLHRLFPRAGFWYWNSAIIVYYVGWLCVGINSSILSYFIVGFFSQWFLRLYRPEWFVKYNYILSAGMDGGTQVIVFILTFAVFGGAGKTVDFPQYWGNRNMDANGNALNFDYCLRTT